MSEELKLREEIAGVLFFSFPNLVVYAPISHGLAVSKLLALVEREKAELIEVIKDLMFQFAYPTQHKGKPAMTSGGLSALELAFGTLGWSDPYPCPQMSCQMEGCNEWATCGTPTPNGYKCVCGKHFRELQK